MGFNTFLNWQQSNYFSWKKSNKESSEELEAKDRKKSLEEAQLKALKGFDPSRKGKIMIYDEGGYLGIKGYSSNTMSGESEGTLLFAPETLEFFERILKDIDNFLSNADLDPDPGFENDNYAPYLVRNNCILYGAPGTGKTEFVRELNRMLIEKYSQNEEPITDPNDPRYGLENNQPNQSLIPIFEINGERLQTGGQTMKDLNTHEKLAEIIKVLKQEAFGDTFSTKPYIVFVDEADQARNTMAGDKAALLEEWKNFLSNASDSGGLGKDGQDAINPAQDRNSIFIIATNNYEAIDPAIKRRGRLGKKFNFTWNPATLKGYSNNPQTHIDWPQINGQDDPNWKFADNKEYQLLFKMAEKFGFAMFSERFVDHANKIIAGWQNLKNNKDEYESKIKFELGEENKYWCATCSKEVEKETDRQRQERINKAIKDATQDLEGGAKKDKEKEITDQESKIIKGKCGHEGERICNWLLHYIYTFHLYNDKDDLNSFTKAEQIKRYQFGDNQLLRERIRELGDQLYNNHVELGNVVGGSLLNMVNTLDAIKEEINAAEIRALKDEAYQVRKDLQQATLDVKALEGQIDALRQKISSVGSSSSSGSSFSFPSATGILGSTSTTVRNAIVGVRNQLVGVVNDLINDMNDLNQQITNFVNSLNASGGASTTVINEFNNLQTKQNNLVQQIKNLQNTINSL
ncbi:MAG: hypothetical protein MRERV_28c021 [Mycoplasmataceae bacterium RV_VA103A]|nr:MAG: hypothetical protein MRERV_28c021 [Mycoplasmataceae bacterium RV_VA103A]